MKELNLEQMSALEGGGGCGGGCDDDGILDEISEFLDDLLDIDIGI